MNADTAGTGGSGTAVTVDSTTGFPTAGTILVDSELITYTSKSSTQLLRCKLLIGTNGTATPVLFAQNDKAHGGVATGLKCSKLYRFGSAVQASTVTLEPGLWSKCVKFGEVLVATK